MVALNLHAAGEGQEGHDGGDEDGGGLTAAARSHVTTDRLGEKQGRGRIRGVDAHGQARNVDALGHHAHGDHPFVGGIRELGNTVGSIRIVGEDDCGGLAGDEAQVAGVGARVLLVRGDDEAARVRHGAAHLLEAQVGGAQDGGDPLTLGVERGAPRLLHHVLGEGLAQAGAYLVTRVGTPGHLSGVGHEQDGAHDAVLEGIAVAVGVVRARTSDTLLVFLVGDEGDRRGVGAEGRARQGQAARRVREGLAHAVAPRQGVAGVVDLVEDDESAVGAGTGGMDGRIGTDLRVGDSHTVEVRAGHALRVRKVRVDVDAKTRGARGPLPLEVLGGAHDGQLVDDAARNQLSCKGQGESRLTCARGRDRQEVARGRGHVAVQGSGLPGAQPANGCAPGRLAHLSEPFPPSEKGQLRPFLPIESRSSLQVGHTGYCEASRVGIHTLPHRATTGWPVTMEEFALSLRTKWAKRSPSPSVRSLRVSVRSSRPVEDAVEGPEGAEGPVGSSRALRMVPIVRARGCFQRVARVRRERRSDAHNKAPTSHSRGRGTVGWGTYLTGVPSPRPPCRSLRARAWRRRPRRGAR